jgi:hypothetical protein
MPQARSTRFVTTLLDSLTDAFSFLVSEARLIAILDPGSSSVVRWFWLDLFRLDPLKIRRN